MKSRVIFASLPIVFFGAAVGAVERYDLEVGRSQLVFSVPYVHGVLGEAVGEFADLEGRVVYDPADPTRSEVLVRVRTASVETQFESRDVDLRSERFLDSGRYPEAVFRSQRIERSDGGFRAHGVLELRGQTRPVSIRFEVQELAGEGGGRLWVTGSTRLDRREFGIQGPGLAGDFVIGDSVSLRFNLMLLPAAS
ncbi:MAG: YceI family protein [Thermoanaerobaculia bacterium]|nr:YceI family protein [Thermoanaerobaculia bacterium]